MLDIGEASVNQTLGLCVPGSHGVSRKTDVEQVNLNLPRENWRSRDGDPARAPGEVTVKHWPEDGQELPGRGPCLSLALKMCQGERITCSDTA